MGTLKLLTNYNLAWFFLKYGNSDLVKKIGVEKGVSEKESEDASPEELVKDLQSLGPTFIKLGQFLSTQIDFLPIPYQDALANLQDQAETFPYEQVEKIIFEELGFEIKTGFKEFMIEPFAAASLSQVHQATLRNGRLVAVKIQRPHIQEKILKDLDMLEELAHFLDSTEILGKNYYWIDKIHSFRTSLLNEIDFRKEAQHLRIFSRNLKEFEDIIIPFPINDYTSSRVLTMEYISSKKITKIHPLLKIDIPVEKLGEDLFKAYLKQIFIDGFIHIDPHPGNVYLTDTQQLALLDLGMVEHIPPQFQQDLLKLLLAICEGKGEEAADLVIKLGHQEESFQYYKFREEIADLIIQQLDLNWDQMAMGKLLLKIARHSGENNLRLPAKFNTLGKTLLNLDAVIKSLSPKLNPNEFIRQHSSQLLTNRLQHIFTESTLGNIFFEFTDLLYRLPSKINHLLGLLEKNELKVKIDTIDQHRLMKGFEKIANRIGLGLVLAALIVGGAILMTVETSFRLFGYPGLAILLFLGACLGGLLFILNIILYDEKSRKK